MHDVSNLTSRVSLDWIFFDIQLYAMFVCVCVRARARVCVCVCVWVWVWVGVHACVHACLHKQAYAKHKQA